MGNQQSSGNGKIGVKGLPAKFSDDINSKTSKTNWTAGECQWDFFENIRQLFRVFGNVNIEDESYLIFIYKCFKFAAFRPHCKPIPVMKTGFSLCMLSLQVFPCKESVHRENPVFITGMGLQCCNPWHQEYASLCLVHDFYRLIVRKISIPKLHLFES